MYTKTSNTLVGAHAVALIGWGTDAGKDYWLFANSWGKNWGEGGAHRRAAKTRGMRCNETRGMRCNGTRDARGQLATARTCSD